MNKPRNFSMIALLLLAIFGIRSHAFSSLTNLKHASPQTMQSSGRSGSMTKLSVGGGGLFGNIFGGPAKKEEEDQGTANPKAIMNFAANTVKVGALRFFLQIYLVGEQNKPSKGSWVLSTASGDTLEMYYKDGSGMFSIDLNDSGIQIYRKGQKPSLGYMLQESVMLHGVLDELHQVAFGTEDIDPEKRLLQLTDSAAIDEARKALPARQEK
jgi:hypothetical protein